MKKSLIIVGVGLLLLASAPSSNAGLTPWAPVFPKPSLIERLPLPQAGFCRFFKKVLKKGIKIPLNPPGGWKF